MISTKAIFAVNERKRVGSAIVTLRLACSRGAILKKQNELKLAKGQIARMYESDQFPEFQTTQSEPPSVDFHSGLYPKTQCLAPRVAIEVQTSPIEPM